MFRIKNVVFEHDYNFTDAEHLKIESIIQHSESYDNQIVVSPDDFSLSEIQELEDNVYNVCQILLSKRELVSVLNVKEEELNKLPIEEVHEFKYLFDKYKHLLKPEVN